MWLSKQTACGGQTESAHAKVGTVTIGGADAAVQLGGEQRSIGLIAPQGIRWNPSRNEQVLVLETDDGERFILGAAVNVGSLGEGEVCLKCGETWLKLSCDGAISAEGDVHICGDVYLTGRLFVNGVEITPIGELYGTEA